MTTWNYLTTPHEPSVDDVRELLALTKAEGITSAFPITLDRLIGLNDGHQSEASVVFVWWSDTGQSTLDRVLGRLRSHRGTVLCIGSPKDSEVAIDYLNSGIDAFVCPRAARGISAALGHAQLHRQRRLRQVDEASLSHATSLPLPMLAALHPVPTLMGLLDEGLRLGWCNDSWKKVLGLNFHPSESGTEVERAVFYWLLQPERARHAPLEIMVGQTFGTHRKLRLHLSRDEHQGKYVLVGEDLTRQQSRKSSNELELAQMRELMRHSSDGFVFLDLSQRLIDATPQALHFLGNALDDLFGRSFASLFQSSSPSELARLRKSLIVAGKPPLVIPHRGHRLELQSIPSERGTSIRLRDVTGTARQHELNQDQAMISREIAQGADATSLGARVLKMVIRQAYRCAAILILENRDSKGGVQYTTTTEGVLPLYERPLRYHTRTAARQLLALEGQPWCALNRKTELPSLWSEHVQRLNFEGVRLLPLEQSGTRFGTLLLLSHDTTYPDTVALRACEQAVELLCLAQQRDSVIRKLDSRAHRDPLTGALNRFQLEQRLAKLLDDHQTQGRRLGLLYLDLDHFKRLNDTYGHDAGDHVLRFAVERMRQLVRKDDLIIRMGGDEFLIVLQDLANLEALERIAESLRDAIGVQTEFNHLPLRVSVSIGASLSPVTPAEEDSVRSWLKSTDVALYEAKNAGRNRVSLLQDEQDVAGDFQDDRLAELPSTSTNHRIASFQTSDYASSLTTSAPVSLSESASRPKDDANTHST